MSSVLASAESGINLNIGLQHKGLIDEDLWTRMTKRIMRDENVEMSLAQRIMDQALGFLYLCAIDPGHSYSPTPMVDIGWHTFILYTKPYMDFCERVAGHYIHHAPSDEEGVDYGTGNAARTVEAMKRHSLFVDEMLWNTSDAYCKKGCGTDCRDSSGSGGESNGNGG
jgi:hypothetical protein